MCVYVCVCVWGVRCQSVYMVYPNGRGCLNGMEMASPGDQQLQACRLGKPSCT